MGDLIFDPNDLLREFDTISRSQRSLVAECERQQTRLIQLLRWYDHQRAARTVELRRQSERLNKEVRQQINNRSKMVVKERARLKHLLDDDNIVNRTEIFRLNTSTSLFQSQEPIDTRKRKSLRLSFTSIQSSLNQNKHLDKQQDSSTRFLPTPFEQRNRMNTVLNKCLYQLEECEGLGYDHFLKTCDPKRNAQVLAQRILNDKNQSQYR